QLAARLHGQILTVGSLLAPYQIETLLRRRRNGPGLPRYRTPVSTANQGRGREGQELHPLLRHGDSSNGDGPCYPEDITEFSGPGIYVDYCRLGGLRQK